MLGLPRRDGALAAYLRSVLLVDRTWDVDSKTQNDVLEGHTGEVFSVAISDDGTTLVSGSGDETLR